MLMTSKPMFDLAYDGGFGIGGFNVNNMEMTQGIIEACAELRSPVILQISKGARAYANIRFLKHIIDACVEEYPQVPICIHCDHGDTMPLMQQCIDDGYTSVMMDGSHHPYEQNIDITRQAVELAHANGVVVEGELGKLGGIEEDVVGLDAEEYEKNIEQFLTDPEQAADFAQRTGIDSLAVAIGTSHGAFKFKNEPKLAFDRIEAIMKTCPGLPLVMHGSSSVPKAVAAKINEFGGRMKDSMGVPEEQIAMAVRKYGVCKVNVDTDYRMIMTATIREVFAKNPEEFDPRKYLGPARDAMREMCKQKLEMLNCVGKADEVIAHWKKEGEPMPLFYKKDKTGLSLHQ
ncbi:MAG: ketose-bisphosphate aldolase [Phycisphaeraceae bacterium]|nr:ketose-bisphosphate aldolase [Phycisphaeraceae bacterium]